MFSALFPKTISLRILQLTQPLLQRPLKKWDQQGVLLFRNIRHEKGRDHFPKNLRPFQKMTYGKKI